MEHEWFKQQIMAYLTDGLEGDDRARFDVHAAACEPCAAALAEETTADAAMRRLFAAPAAGLEDRLIAGLRSVPQRRMRIHPLVRKAAVGVAAAIMLGGFGYIAPELTGKNNLLTALMEGKKIELIQAVSGSGRSTHASGYVSLSPPSPQSVSVLDSSNSMKEKNGFGPQIADLHTTDDKLVRQASDDAMVLALQQRVPPQGVRNLAWKSDKPQGGEGRPQVQEQERLVEEKQTRDQTISSYIKIARENIDHQDYAAASGVLDQITALDPHNDYAIGIRPFVQDKAMLQDQRRQLEKRDLQIERQLSSAEEKNIPYDDILRYPNNYPDISQLHDQESHAKTSEIGRENTGKDGQNVLQDQQKINQDRQYNRSIIFNNLHLGGPAQTPSDPHYFKLDMLTLNQDKSKTENADDATVAGKININTANGGTLTLAGIAGSNNGYTGGTTVDNGPVNGMAQFRGRPIGSSGGDEAFKTARTLSDSDFDFDDGKPRAGSDGGMAFTSPPSKSSDAVAGTKLPVQLAQGPSSENPNPPPPAEPTKPVAPSPVAPPAPRAAPAIAPRVVIRHGTMEFEVDNFDSASMQIGKIVTEQGGFVSTVNSEKMANGKVQGTVVVRLPPDRLDVLVLQLRGLGDLKGQKITADDVTMQYTDLQSELRAANAMQDRLLEIIKSGKGEVKDLVAAEKELGVWREKSEKIQGEINYYNNLAALSTLEITLTERDIRQAAVATETETINTWIQTEDVEKSRADALAALADAKARITQSQMKQFEAGQLVAQIVAEVSPESAGVIEARLKQLGHIDHMEIDRHQSAAPGAAVPAGVPIQRQATVFNIALYNLANVAPRQTDNLNLACENVEQAYADVLHRIAKSNGRVVTSNLNRPRPDQQTATINFEIPTADADAVLTDVRGLGEVMQLTVTENPDAANVTAAKRGFALQLDSLATVPPRQTAIRVLAAPDVSAAYNAILSAAQSAGARISTSILDEQDKRNVIGTLDLQIPRSGVDLVQKAADGAKAVLITQSTNNAAESDRTTNSKIGMRLTIGDLRQLPPRQTTSLRVIVADPEAGMDSLLNTAISASGQAVMQQLEQDGAHLVIDLPQAGAGDLISRARALGTVQDRQESKDPAAPEGSLARARVDITLLGESTLTSPENGLWASVRGGLDTSVRGLLWSMQLIVIGLCVAGPFALVIWVGWKIFHRRKPRAAVT